MTIGKSWWTPGLAAGLVAAAAVAATPAEGPQARTAGGPAATASAPAAPSQLWLVRGGTTTIRLDADALRGQGVTLTGADVRAVPIMDRSTLVFTVTDGTVIAARDGQLVHDAMPDGPLRLAGGQRERVIDGLVIAPAGAGGLRAPWIAGPATGGTDLVLARMKATFDPTSGMLSVLCPEVRATAELADALGRPGLAGQLIGAVTIHARAEWIGGAKPSPAAKKPETPAPDRSTLAVGPDMTFCQLYGLIHLSGARLGDIVGLAEATTSWNVGTADMMWFAIPNEEHPFIVMNLFRIEDGRIEQIGQSHIKHGFYALGSHQCGGPSCTFEPGHGPGNWLGTGCTDTYGATLNGVQSGMGPRYEVNPWTGYWYYPDSHMATSHTHDAIQHRLQVHDADLDPAQHPDAQYVAEGYYVMLDDVNVMNSASWKTVTVSGSPGGVWSFGMSGASTYPNIGFAIDAWGAGTRTILAQEVPVQEFISPDGRCYLAVKTTQLSETTWHYEYALYNIDMDRQVGSFSIPVMSSAGATNLGFHAVEHADEPFNTADADAVPIDNAAWTPEVGADAVAWSTTTNPLRWGTMYNFWFDADAPPATTTVTLGMFRAGTPETVTGLTTGPAVASCPADLDLSGDVGFDDLLLILSSWGPCPGCPEDLNGDDIVGFDDLLVVLSAWGPC